MKDNPKGLMIALILLGGFSPLLGSLLYDVGLMNAPIFFWIFSIIMLTMAALTWWKEIRPKS